MDKPTELEIEFSRKLRDKFGHDTRAVRFADDEEANSVFVISAVNCPVAGVNSYGSIGLYKHAQHMSDKQISVEIVAACASSTPHMDNLLASCVFDSIKNGSNIVYGSCIRNIVAQYEISSTLQNVTFVSPFLWNDLNKVVVGNTVIYYLMMLPISDSEALYLQTNGIEALERRFNDAQIDIFDINRLPAI